MNQVDDNMVHLKCKYTFSDHTFVDKPAVNTYKQNVST